jgi:DNA replication and repair protein RecF
VLVTRLELRDFRNYEAAELDLPAGLAVVVGPNGAGKTNLLEAVYFGCTGASPRTSNERELVRRGATVARVVIGTRDEDAAHRIEAGFQPGEAKRLRVDGSAVNSLSTLDARPLVSVFMPERLELVKGAPSARRAHLDQFVAALWPARAGGRSAYSRALAQRNALLGRIRAGLAGPAALDAWDTELAREGIALMEDRAAAVEGLREPFARLAGQLGLPGAAEVSYRPRSAASDAAGLAAELGDRRQADLERGFGSQGQQRTALLSLLFAERELLAERRARPPLMLLDDVMSELDGERRQLLSDLLRSGGQAIVTATEAEHVPGVENDELIGVSGGALLVAA